MTPNDEQPDRTTNDSGPSFSAVEEQDNLVQAFRDFVNEESSRRGQDRLPEVVADFSRRLNFLTSYVVVDFQTDDLATMILKLSDAKMAEIALDAVDSDKGRDRLTRYLKKQPYPHYEADPTNRDLIVRIEQNGSRAVGHFVDGNFIAVNDDH